MLLARWLASNSEIYQFLLHVHEVILRHSRPLLLLRTPRLLALSLLVVHVRLLGLLEVVRQLVLVGGMRLPLIHLKIYKSNAALSVVDPLPFRHKILSQQACSGLRLGRGLAQGRRARVKVGHEKMVSRRGARCLSALDG